MQRRLHLSQAATLAAILVLAHLLSPRAAVAVRQSVQHTKTVAPVVAGRDGIQKEQV